MANFISIIRVFFVFIAVALLYKESLNAYIWAFILTIIAFAFDGLDGYVARKFNETSKLGAVLDIMSDRIVENTLWVAFAVFGWIPMVFPIIALTRSFVVDSIRSVAMEQGYTAFGNSSMQDSKLGYFICSSKFSRISYAVAKLGAFMLLIVANAPIAANTVLLYTSIFAYILSIIAIEFCVVRGLPVIFESKKFFARGQNEKV